MFGVSVVFDRMEQFGWNGLGLAYSPSSAPSFWVILKQHWRDMSEV